MMDGWTLCDGRTAVGWQDVIWTERAGPYISGLCQKRDVNLVFNNYYANEVFAI